MNVSVLTQVTVTFVEWLRPDISSVDPLVIEEIIASHDLDGDHPPAWMVAWFTHIVAGRAKSDLFEIPEGYPTGDCGLVNVLFDIEKKFGSLGFTDHGEEFVWDIPACGLRVLILRETAGAHYGAMRPIDSDINGWLGDQYQRLRLGGELAQLS